MTKCPSWFGKCEQNAKYDNDDFLEECLQYCTPNPCSSKLNNIFSDCTQYFTNETLDTEYPSIPPKCLDLLGDKGVASLSPFCKYTTKMVGGEPPGINPLSFAFAPCAVCGSHSGPTPWPTYKNICKASYTGKTSPIFQKNVDYACKNKKPYPVTSTLYPKCSPYLNNLWTKCANEFDPTNMSMSMSPNCNMFVGNFVGPGVTLPPVSNSAPTWCLSEGDAALVNEATGEYVGNEIVCTTKDPGKQGIDDGTSCLAQYNDPPSQAFCNKFESPPKKGLSTGAIVGIVIGSLAVLLIIGVVLTRKKGKKRSRSRRKRSNK